MSMDKSLVLRNKLSRHRNVLTRTERLKILLEDGRWEEGKSVFCLPKVRTIAVRKKGKKEEAKEAETAAATPEAAAATEGTSAGGKKPAASKTKT